MDCKTTPINPITGEINFPVKEQLKDLGLSRADVRSYRGKRALDIGCGSSAGLVYSLRQSGVNAEGIDPAIRSPKDFLIRQGITSQNPMPRPDSYYDLVLAHALSPIDHRFSSYPEVANYFKRALGMPSPSEEILAELKKDGEAILPEALRVLKKTGKMIIFHRANRLGDFEQKIQKLGFEISHKTSGNILDLRNVAKGLGVDLSRIIFMYQRTVISASSAG